jgi:voltage-dependent calcium channel L type alpha-1D
MNAIFIGIFTMELVLKWIAMSPRLYFRDGYNWFDFVVVVSSIADVAVTFAGVGSNR